MQQHLDSAREILKRDPNNVDALRSIGVIEAVRERLSASDAALRVAEQASRRDARTQLALIESAVRVGDVDDALRHYNRALSTNVSVRDVLVPTLAAASQEPRIRDRIVRLMADRPLWWSALLDRMIATSTPGATLAVARALSLRPEEATEGWRLSAVISKLADSGDMTGAIALARRSQPGISLVLADDGFDRAAGLPPFAWVLTNQEGLSAVAEYRDSATGPTALSLVAEAGVQGVFAKRLMAMRPGSYRLTWIAGEIPAYANAQPVVSVRCVGPGGAVLVRQPVTGGRQSTNLKIESGCHGQWIEVLTAPGGGADGDVDPWIDDIAITSEPS